MGRTFLPRPPVTCRQHLLLLLLSALPGRAAAQKPALVREILLAIQGEPPWWSPPPGLVKIFYDLTGRDFLCPI